MPKIPKAIGKFTKPNIWDKMRRRVTKYNGINLGEQTIDPGVVFFVAALNYLGAKTRYSCEGHPDGFYIEFRGTYKFARKINSVGFFGTEIAWRNWWCIRGHDNDNMKSHVDCLRWAADTWQKKLGLTVSGLVSALKKNGFNVRSME